VIKLAIALNIIKEERKNLEMQLTRIKSELESLPEGSIQLKTIKGKQYAYRQYRNCETKKMISVSIKKTDDIDHLKTLIQRRAYLAQKAKHLTKEIQMMDRVIKTMKE
jgi:ribosomal protein S4E